MIAGSTGHLGRALVEVGLSRGFHIKAIARRPDSLDEFRDARELEVIRAEATRPAELEGLCEGVDMVISALGITRQRDRVGFREVDYLANLHLLEEARRAGVPKFIYTSGYGVERHPRNPMYRAKLEFEAALKASGLSYLIVRPSGFFSDMVMLFEMAREGRVYLLGPGQGRLNPIHLLDLAEFYYLHLDDKDATLEVGGPVTYSFNEIAALAFGALGRPGAVSRVPTVAVRLFLPIVRLFSRNTYAQVDAFARIMVEGAEAPPFGRRTLEEAFREAAGSP